VVQMITCTCRARPCPLPHSQPHECHSAFQSPVHAPRPRVPAPMLAPSSRHRVPSGAFLCPHVEFASQVPHHKFPTTDHPEPCSDECMDTVVGPPRPPQADRHAHDGAYRGANPTVRPNHACTGMDNIAASHQTMHARPHRLAVKCSWRRP